MGGKRTADKPKMRKRTKFTILAVVNLTWSKAAGMDDSEVGVYER